MGRIRPSQPPDSGRRISARALQQEGPSTDKLPPKFSFRYLDRSRCITRCTEEERLAFVSKMHLLSQLTWSQLRQAPKDGLGYEKIDRDSIRAGIPTAITEDVNFIAFRFHGKAPMVGYRSDDGTFYIVWFDRDFTLYDRG
jgi:hypothetical protein